MKSAPKYRTLITDDEFLARERLRKLLTPFSQTIEIIGEAKNGIECKAMVNSLKPDLIFLDIQMPGLNGFEVLQQVEHLPLVVFCTAYDEFALKAFETHSVDYLVKPVTEERIAQTIEKLNFFDRHFDKQLIQRIIETAIKSVPHEEITSIPVKLGDRMLIFNIEDISYFRAEEKYVAIHTIKGKKYLCEYPIKELEEKLNARFVRIQRSLLINRSLVKEVLKHSNLRYKVKMKDTAESLLVSGRNYAEQVKQLTKF